MVKPVNTRHVGFHYRGTSCKAKRLARVISEKRNEPKQVTPMWNMFMGKKKGQATTLCNIGVNLRLAGEKTLTIA